MGRRENLGGYKGNIPNCIQSVVRGLFSWLASFPGYFPCIYCIYPSAPPNLY